jgi:hypothetical protein
MDKTKVRRPSLIYFLGVVGKLYFAVIVGYVPRDSPMPKSDLLLPEDVCASLYVLDLVYEALRTRFGTKKKM